MPSTYTAVLTTAILVVLSAGGPARAEFILQPSTPPMPPPTSEALPTARPVRPLLPRAQSVPAAVGFGTDIPLSIAVRQIVPAGWAVRYGEGVERDTTVNWVGGKPWPDALRDAIRPAGLRLVFASQARTVTISKR